MIYDIFMNGGIILNGTFDIHDAYVNVLRIMPYLYSMGDIVYLQKEISKCTLPVYVPYEIRGIHLSHEGNVYDIGIGRCVKESELTSSYNKDCKQNQDADNAIAYYNKRIEELNSLDSTC